MLFYAILGGGFLENAHGHFDPVSYFFGAGVATNIGAAAIGLLLGYLWGRAKLRGLHAKLDEHADMHAAHATKLDRLERRLSGSPAGPATPSGPGAWRAP
jgi:hypothetical protein